MSKLRKYLGTIVSSVFVDGMMFQGDKLTNADARKSKKEATIQLLQLFKDSVEKAILREGLDCYIHGTKCDKFQNYMKVHYKQFKQNLEKEME